METRPGSDAIKARPEEAREAAQLVVDAYGEPHEATESLLPGSPAPHSDSVESFIDHRVAAEMVTPLTQFDGSVVVEQAAEEGERQEQAQA